MENVIQFVKLKIKCSIYLIKINVYMNVNKNVKFVKITYVRFVMKDIF